MIEFYLNKIKKYIALDESMTIVVKQILEEFYSEAIRSEARSKAWLEGFREGRNYREDVED